MATRSYIPAGGDRLQAVDLKLYMAVRWYIGGKLDHIPAPILRST